MFVSLFLLSCQPHIPQMVAGERQTFSKSYLPNACQNLEPYYQKCLDASGVAIVGSSLVGPGVLKATEKVLNQMLKPSNPLRKAMAKAGLRVAVVDHTHEPHDLPGLLHTRILKEFMGFEPAFFAYTLPNFSPVALTREHDLNCEDSGYTNYGVNSITVHEVAHAVHWTGLKQTQPDFSQRLLKTYEDSVLKKGLWKDTYAATNAEEYWAVGSMVWVPDKNELWDQNPDGWNFANSGRAELRRYDPALATLLNEVYGEVEWEAPCAKDFSAHELREMAEKSPITFKQIGPDKYELSMSGEGYFKAVDIGNINESLVLSQWKEQNKEKHFHTYEFIDVVSKPETKIENNLFTKTIILESLKHDYGSFYVDKRFHKFAWNELLTIGTSHVTLQDIRFDGEVIVFDKRLNESIGVDYLSRYFFANPAGLELVRPGVYQQSDRSNKPQKYNLAPVLKAGSHNKENIQFRTSKQENGNWLIETDHPQAYMKLQSYIDPFSNEKKEEPFHQVWSQKIEMKIKIENPEEKELRQSRVWITADEKYRLQSGIYNAGEILDICADGAIIYHPTYDTSPLVVGPIGIEIIPEPQYLKAVGNHEFILTARSGQPNYYYPENITSKAFRERKCK